LLYPHIHPTHLSPLSFPTRRSSDLDRTGRVQAYRRSGHRATRSSEKRRPSAARVSGSTRSASSEIYIGLMSGTSLDGVDSVLEQDRKSTRLNSSHVAISYAVFCLKK